MAWCEKNEEKRVECDSSSCYCSHCFAGVESMSNLKSITLNSHSLICFNTHETIFWSLCMSYFGVWLIQVIVLSDLVELITHLKLAAICTIYCSPSSFIFLFFYFFCRALISDAVMSVLKVFFHVLLYRMFGRKAKCSKCNCDS